MRSSDQRAPDTTSEADGALLDVRDLRFRYSGERQWVLNGINFSLNRGDFVIISGASGSGKTTFLRCINGIIPHLIHGEVRGNVLLRGVPTDQLAPHEIAGHVGTVFQNPQSQAVCTKAQDEIIFNLENLGVDKAAIDAAVATVFKDLTLTGFWDRHPLELSGGEVQRLIIGSSIATDPPLLLLDEPFSMLDSTSAQELLEVFDQLHSRGVAIILFEHRTALFRNGRVRRLKMVNGVLHEDNEGPPPFLKREFAPQSTETYLRVRSLNVAFSKKPILNDVSFDVRAGEVVGLLGANGSGKTTLIRALGQLIPYDGVIKVEGEDRQNFGVVFQDPNYQLFNPTVREELLFNATYDPERYRTLLAQFKLEHVEEKSPLLLSEGEKKRVSIALNIYRSTSGILLDEPTIGQDDANRAVIGGALHEQKSARCVLVATNDLDFALRYLPRSLLLASGAIIRDSDTWSLLHDETELKKAGLRLPGFIKQEIETYENEPSRRTLTAQNV